MGDTDYNLNVLCHRCRPYTGGNDWTINVHRTNLQINTTSPGIAVGDVRAMVGVANDIGKTQADFDGVASSIGGGFGDWYVAQSAGAKQCLRDLFQHWT